MVIDNTSVVLSNVRIFKKHVIFGDNFSMINTMSYFDNIIAVTAKNKINVNGKLTLR